MVLLIGRRTTNGYHAALPRANAFISKQFVSKIETGSPGLVTEMVEAVDAKCTKV